MFPGMLIGELLDMKTTPIASLPRAHTSLAYVTHLPNTHVHAARKTRSSLEGPNIEM